MINVTKLITKGGIFPRGVLKEIKFDKKQVEVIDKQNSAFGTAFGVHLEYTIRGSYDLDKLDKAINLTYSRKDKEVLTNYKKSLKEDEVLTAFDLTMFTVIECLLRSGVFPEGALELLDILSDKFYFIESACKKFVQDNKDKVITVNPIFGTMKSGIGGDGDILIGDTLVEVKCSKNPNFKIMYQRQLLAYYCLNNFNGNKFKINKLGYYNPLYDIYHEVSVEELGVDLKKLEEKLIEVAKVHK